MIRRLSRSNALFLLSLLSLAFLGSAPAPEENALLRTYASWEELTPGPHKVPAASAALCVPPHTVTHPGVDDHQPSGTDHFIRVYANPPAVPLLRSHRGEKFPVGAMIAKVKLLQGSDRPVSVAFMIKRKAGFKPSSLDWEFLFFDGQMKQQAAAGSRCQECHGGLKEVDGVFASYLLSGTKVNI
jgi:hypothetical protein